MYYFAYGSNLDITQMQRRCPGSRPIGRAKLSGYNFQFDGLSQNWSHAAAANIIPAKGKAVWGALYEMSDQNQVELDRYEPNYERATLEVESEKFGRVMAITYLRSARKLGRPSPEYLSAIVKGAKDNDLPRDYVQTVVALADLERAGD